jgi:hypothetical protein
MVHAGWGRRRFLLATSVALATKGRTIIARAQTRRGEIVAGLSEREISPYCSVAIHAVSDRLRGSKARRDHCALPHDVGIA